MKVSIYNQVCYSGLIALRVARKLSNNNANQPDPFFVRAAHKKGSGYLQRYAIKLINYQ